MLKKMRSAARRAMFYHIHKMGPATIAQWQDEGLTRLVEHAVRRVPFYRELYDAAGIHPEDITSVADLPRLPLTRKDMYRSRPAVELVRSDKPARAPWKKTSGSSGHPLTILMSSLMNSRFYNDFVCFRFLLQDRAVTPWAFDRIRVAHINVRARPRPTHLFVTITDFQEDMDGVTRRIGEFMPDMIASYTSILLDLARRVAADPSLMPKKPRYCSCFGEMVTPAVRAEIERSLGCELFDRYGGTEMGAVASECTEHDGMHVHCESAIIEIVDDHGQPVAPGQSGKVVITDLTNYNMPFIRYEIGDSGRLVNTPCACGQHTPRLHLEGRYSAHLSFGKRRVHHLEFDGALDGLMNEVLQYRIVKESDRTLIAQIVPGPRYSAETERSVRERMAALVPANVSVRVETVAFLPRTARGKSQIVADLTEPTPAPAGLQ